MKHAIQKMINWFEMTDLYIGITLNKRVIICNLGVLLILIIFKCFKVFDWPTFLAAFLPALAPFTIALLDSQEYSSNTKVISLCYDYMHKKEGISIDDILGILISNKYRNKIKQPTNSFFDILEEKCNSEDIEEKRRIAEAVPMLYKINRHRTKEIMKKLRDDHHPRYRDDNRRRIIESFRYCNKFNPGFVNQMLEIREGDSMYTVVAIIEIIIFTNIIKFKDKERRLKNLKNVIVENKHFNNSQQEFIDEAIQFLNEVSHIKKHISLDIIFNRYMEKFKQSKFYMRILISKNMINICPYHKQCQKKDKCLNHNNKRDVLAFFDLCFNDEKNVRRPMAMEEVCYCLLRMIKFPEVGNEAKERIMKLIKDQDSIISITTFDYIYAIHDREPHLFGEILEYCSTLPDDHILKMRAKHVADMV